VLQLYVAPDAGPVLAAAPVAAGVVGEEASLAVPDGDGAALGEDVRQVGGLDERAVAAVEGEAVCAALLLARVPGDDVGAAERLGLAPAEPGAAEVVNDLDVVVDGEADAVAAVGEVGAEPGGAAGAGGAEVGLGGSVGLAAGEGVGGVLVDGDGDVGGDGGEDAARQGGEVVLELEG
jgi:hypothetical protein